MKDIFAAAPFIEEAMIDLTPEPLATGNTVLDCTIYHNTCKLCTIMKQEQINQIFAATPLMTLIIPTQ